LIAGCEHTERWVAGWTGEEASAASFLSFVSFHRESHRFECVAVGFFVNVGHSACRKARCHVTLGDLCGRGKKLFDTHQASGQTCLKTVENSDVALKQGETS
jgi:hypothetical protein